MRHRLLPALLLAFLLVPGAAAQEGAFAYFTLGQDPANTGVPVLADASASRASPGARIVEYAWLVGEGEAYEPGSATQNVTFTAAGVQNVSLRVTDSEGATDFFNRSVLVRGAVPNANFYFERTEEADGELVIVVNATFSSPSSGAERIVRYEWNWGDGEGFEEGGVRETHVYETPGQYRVTLRVTDDEGRVGTVNEFVTFRSTFFVRLLRVLEEFDAFLAAARLTLVLAVGTTVAGFALAVLLAMLRVSRNALVRAPATAYIELIRGTPLLVQILAIWLALPFLGIKLSILWSGAVALIINTSAYQAEAIRGGIQAIPTGQMEAATSLGMTHLQAMRFVILPQAFRLTLPPLGNEFIILLKDTSLLSAIGVLELTGIARIFSARTFLVLETWIVVAAMYFVMTYSLSLGLRYLEKRLAIPGLGMGGAH